MPSEFELVTPVALPSQCSISHIYKPMHLADAFSIQLPANASTNPDLLTRFIFMHQPTWIGALTKLRDAIVACFGLKTAKHLATLTGDARDHRVGIFKIYSTGASEIVIGEDDKHLNFRISVLCAAGPAPESNRQMVVSTVVQCHNRLGRVYIFVIAPFHRMVIKASLLRAARIGWPRATGA